MACLPMGCGVEHDIAIQLDGLFMVAISLNLGKAQFFWPLLPPSCFARFWNLCKHAQQMQGRSKGGRPCPLKIVSLAFAALL